MKTTRKVWMKPAIETAAVKLAQLGSFSNNDTSQTHRS